MKQTCRNKSEHATLLGKTCESIRVCFCPCVFVLSSKSPLLYQACSELALTDGANGQVQDDIVTLTIPGNTRGLKGSFSTQNSDSVRVATSCSIPVPLLLTMTCVCESIVCWTDLWLCTAVLWLEEFHVSGGCCLCLYFPPSLQSRMFICLSACSVDIVDGVSEQRSCESIQCVASKVGLGHGSSWHVVIVDRRFKMLVVLAFFCIGNRAEHCEALTWTKPKLASFGRKRGLSNASWPTYTV